MISINPGDLPRFLRGRTDLNTPLEAYGGGIAKEIITSRVINTLNRILISEIIDFIE
jgi:hypothetical protein